MKLKMTKFRVRNYRNINDSGWIPVENVAALVGCNESGKSALLKALHKFNPAIEEPYDAQTEFPRDCFAKDYRDNGKGLPVCGVEFEFADEFRSELQKSTGSGKIPEKVVATRYYDGRLSFEYDPDIPDDAVEPRKLHEVLDDFKNEARKLEGEMAATQETITSLASWVDESKKDLSGTQDLREERGIALLGQIRSEADQHSQQGMADSVKVLQGKLDDLTTRATAEPPSKQLDSAIKNELPVFIYFDSYNLLNSVVHLPTFCEELTSSPADPRVRMTRAVFKDAELDEKEIADLSQEDVVNGATDDAIQNDQQRKGLRFVKLNSASNSISQRFSKWYGQRQHKIKYHADGNYFRILVSDDRSPEVYIELEERSKGFQWFFSFYTIFSAEADDGHKKAILLLDEPGLHLHPSAQQELLSFFEMLAEKNSIIYTTHSQYLIDDKHIDRTYAVTVDESGHSSVSVDGCMRDIKAIFPIKAAMERALLQELLLRKKVLLVEGDTDAKYLQVLSEHCKKDGKPGLPEDIYIHSCRGAEKSNITASVFLDHEVRPVILLDSDDVGKRKRNSLLNKHYNKHKDAVLMLGKVFEQENYEIEDMIGEELIIPILKNIIGKEIELSKADSDKKSLVDRIEKAAKASSIKLDGWKHKVAQQFVANWSNTDETMPKDILNRAGKLFEKITKCFDMISQGTNTAQDSDDPTTDTTTIPPTMTNSRTDDIADDRVTLH